MTQGLHRLVKFLLHYSQQLHKSGADLHKHASAAEHTAEAKHPQAREKISKMKHNSRLFMQASIHLRHAAHELKQVKE